MKKISKAFSVMTAAVIAASMSAVNVSADDSQEMRDMTTAEIVRDMGLGINLGNTFESCGSWINGKTVKDYETAWGSPVITQKMIQGMADEGFGVVRIPVAWSNMMGDDYTISTDYIDRVQEVVDWTLEAGMYAIVNIHYDGGWWSAFPTDTDECMYRYERMWTQLCDAFGDYGDHVIFESLNEEGGWDTVWNKYDSSDTANKQKSYDLLNSINQKFVDIVRASGKNNGKRHLLIAGYQTDVALTCDEMFKVPNDPEKRCAVSMHYYTPSTFCILEEDADWGKARTTWGTEADYNELNNNMNLIKTRFIDNGIPVIMGEYGCSVKNKTRENINKFLLAACEAMYSRGICPVLWDINYTEDQAWSFYNRGTCRINDDELRDGFHKIAAMGVKETPEINVDSEYEITYGDSAANLNATTNSTGKLSYISSKPSVATVDENGNVTPVKPGRATITVSVEGTDKYLPATATVEVTVKRIANPPVMPETEITIDDTVTSLSQITLPDGWKWFRDVELPAEGESVEAEAIYEDTNYSNRSVIVTITRKSASDVIVPDGGNDKPADKPSTDTPSEKPADTASSDNAGNDVVSTTDTSSTASSENSSNGGDANPATGATAGAAVMLICGAAVLAVKKKK